MCPIYTKTFGGKLWNNLHSVSPNNFLGKKFKMASLSISRQTLSQHRLVQKKLKVKHQFAFYPLKKRCFSVVAI